jgi:glycosyltransferase involved in cell wall biosynthesis
MVTAAPKVIVVQIGARHNYAVPIAFERLGMLEALYTDLCATHGLGRAAAYLGRLPIPMRTRLAALGARVAPPEVAAKTRTFDWIGLQLNLLWRTGQATSDTLVGRRSRALSQTLGESMIRAGYGGATHVYSMFGEGGPFLAQAKRRGLRITTEIYIALSADEIIRAEARAFPGWGCVPPTYTPSLRPPNAVMIEASDTFVCPSEFVREDFLALTGIPRERTSVVPYTVGDRWLSLENRPEPGRLLFAGMAELRKGIHYLAIAADSLNARHRYRFRVTGHVAPEVLGQPVCRSLEFLGHVPRTQVHQEFAAADLLVLPSLAEGSAGATYEALGAGVPVVTTKAAGSVVRDGIDGLIVPERDPEALANAIESIVEDRSRRARMAAAARERAREFTMDKYARRLVASLA